MAWQPGYFYLAPMICPRGEDLAPRIVYRKFINCLLKHGEICRSDISKQKGNTKKQMLETKKSYSKYEKLAKKLVESPFL